MGCWASWFIWRWSAGWVVQNWGKKPGFTGLFIGIMGEFPRGRLGNWMENHRNCPEIRKIRQKIGPPSNGINSTAHHARWNKSNNQKLQNGSY